MPDDDAAGETPPGAAGARECAIVECMGHRKHYGLIREVTRFGGTMLHVFDVDTEQDHFYSAGALYAVTLIAPVVLQEHIDQETRDRKERAEREARWAAERQARLLLLEAQPATQPPPAEPDPLFSEAEGEWSDDGVLTLRPAYYQDAERVHLALMLTSANVFRSTVRDWTDDQRKLAAEWAISSYTAANDHDGVRVPPEPDFILDGSPF